MASLEPPAPAAAALDFAHVARVLGAMARVRGLEVPGFRSPPASGDRSVRRRPGAPAAVAVRLAGRPLDVVVSDMVEGVIVANDLHGAAAEEVRRALRAACRGGQEAA